MSELSDEKLAEIERLAREATVFWCDRKHDDTGLHAGSEVEAATVLALVAAAREQRRVGAVNAKLKLSLNEMAKRVAHLSEGPNIVRGEEEGYNMGLRQGERERDRLRARVAELERDQLDGNAYSLGRAEERAAVVAWVRGAHRDDTREDIADVIERGEHAKAP